MLITYSPAESLWLIAEWSKPQRHTTNDLQWQHSTDSLSNPNRFRILCTRDEKTFKTTQCCNNAIYQGIHEEYDFHTDFGRTVRFVISALMTCSLGLSITKDLIPCSSPRFRVHFLFNFFCPFARKHRIWELSILLNIFYILIILQFPWLRCPYILRPIENIFVYFMSNS